jgi:signal transduction histidine kinase
MGMGDVPHDQAFRIRLARGLTGIFLILCVLAAGRYVTLGLNLPAAAAGLNAVAAIASLVGLRRRPEVAAHLLTVTLLVALVLDNSLTGGFLDPNFGWLYLVPLLAAVLLPGRAVLGYAAAVAAVILAFYAIELGPGVWQTVPPQDHLNQSLFNRLLILLSVVALVRAFEYERRRFGTALAAALEQARAADRAKSEFLANMSHELRTPLTAIVGYGELLLESTPEERLHAEGDLQRITGSAHRLLTLIDEILDLSKIEAGRIELAPVPTDLEQLLTDRVSGLELLVRRGQNTLELHLADDLGVAIVDGHRVGQIVVNLVGNAAKFTHGGHIVVSARREGAELVVEVRDDGIGIAPEKRELVFESFVQADGSTTRRFGGSGLGLTISRRLARILGGDLTLDSAPGVGSTFTLRLPYQPA